jgi:hypothetical protein
MTITADLANSNKPAQNERGAAICAVRPASQTKEYEVAE